MQEVGGSSPPISTDWVRLSVFSACSNLWLLHAFFLFRLFLGQFWFLFFGMRRLDTADFLSPIFTVVPSGVFLGRWNFFVGGRGVTHQFFRCGVGCASVRLMREAWRTQGAFCGMPGAHCACF